MKLLLMDLDGTLLDATYFKQRLFALIAQAYNVSEARVIRVYTENKVSMTTDNWLDSFIQTFAQKSNRKPDIAKLKQAIFDELRVNTLQLNFLRNFDGYKVIFTFGNEKFQKDKMACLQLQRFVDDIIITQEDKIKYIDSLMQSDSLNIKGTPYKEVTIVDDDVRFLIHIKKKYPWITTYEKDSLPTIS